MEFSYNLSISFSFLILFLITFHLFWMHVFDKLGRTCLRWIYLNTSYSNYILLWMMTISSIVATISQKTWSHPKGTPHIFSPTKLRWVCCTCFFFPFLNAFHQTKHTARLSMFDFPNLRLTIAPTPKEMDWTAGLWALLHNDIANVNCNQAINYRLSPTDKVWPHYMKTLQAHNWLVQGFCFCWY